ncbi:Pentatricopeptide repeat-containing protein [Rhynchospora pubera]|uniref:Pentatricopeptide repeat-containing protein n=1 Tax=Rhynchospora pubera TaxID=906938 RepID=A0AAV8CRQ7_9POAL|nr:Pentatricopeptide repeat-containing protein [Rhynchospora pubera]
MLTTFHRPRPRLFAHNLLLHLSCKCRFVSTAHQLFDTMPQRDSITWTPLCSRYGYSQVDFNDTSLHASRDEGNAGVLLDRHTYARAIAVCAKSQHLNHGRIIHGLAVVNGLINSPFVVNCLMDMYLKCGMIDDVRLVFDQAKERDKTSWNSLISAYAKVGWPHVAVDVLGWMHRYGVRLTYSALSTVVKACNSLHCEEISRMIHGCVVKIGLDLDMYVGSALVDLYAKNAGLEEAIEIFKNIPSPNLVAFNALIAGFCRLGNEANNGIKVEALKLYRKMLRRRIQPSKCTYKSVLEACSLTYQIEFGRQVHAHVVVNGLEKDGYIACALISLYSKSGIISGCLKCFDLVSKKNIFVWGRMVNAYIRNGHLKKALELFKEILSLKLHPDSFILSSLVNGCLSMGLILIGKEIHAYMVKSGFDGFTVCCNSLISIYSTVGDIENAIRVFKEIDRIDDSSCCSMILGYGVNGDGREALELFKEMENHGVIMGTTVFLAILTACSHCGLVEEGIRFYETMINCYGLSPDVNHVACIVGLLGRTGKLMEAEEFILVSGFKSNPLVWHTLFQACWLNRDKERSLKAGERLIELEPLNASSYIILYNIYMSMRKFSLAMKTRGLMRERGAVREMGFSWIETSGPVIVFTDGSDNSLPPQYNSLYMKVHKLLLDMKEKSKDSESQIWEMEFHTNNKWDGNSVKFHGELLAACIGLKDLPSFTPIRIVKNQRVCNVCHEVLKLLSHSENREILVKEPTCLHRFNLGKCSCGEFW